MSRRRGKVSSDPLLIERRNWYATVEAENRMKGEEAEFASGIGAEIDHDISKELASRSAALLQSIPLPNTALASPHKPQHGSKATADSLESKVSSPLPVIKNFSGLALDLYDEFSVHTTSYVDDKPKPLKFVRDTKFNAKRWLLPESTAAEDIPFQSETVLICFHGIGESPAKYLRWGSFFRDRGLEVELWGACLPGRMMRTTEPYLTSVVQASGSIVDAMIDIGIVQKPSKKYRQRIRRLFLFGHDIGSLVAFESARLLIAMGIPVNHLIVSSEDAPHHLSTTNLDRFRTKLSDKPIRDILHRMQRLNGCPHSLIERKDLQSIFVPCFRADCKLREDYLFYTDNELNGDEKMDAKHEKLPVQDDNAVLNIPITSLGTVDDISCKEDALLDWSCMTTNRHYYFTFPEGMGGHAYLSLGDIPTCDVSSYTRPSTAAGMSVDVASTSGGGGGGSMGPASTMSPLTSSPVMLAGPGRQFSQSSSQVPLRLGSSGSKEVRGGGGGGSVVSELGSVNKGNIPYNRELTTGTGLTTGSFDTSSNIFHDADDANLEQDIDGYLSYFDRNELAAATALRIIGTILEERHNNLRALMEAFTKIMTQCNDENEDFT